MPRSPHPEPQLAQEAAFAAAFPELASASSAQIRELRAFMLADARVRYRDMQRRQAVAEWLKANQLPLTFPGA